MVGTLQKADQLEKEGKYKEAVEKWKKVALLLSLGFVFASAIAAFTSFGYFVLQTSWHQANAIVTACQNNQSIGTNANGTTLYCSVSTVKP